MLSTSRVTHGRGGSAIPDTSRSRVPAARPPRAIAARARLLRAGGMASILALLPVPDGAAEEAGCGQQFAFVGVTAGEPPIAWITEDIGDACGFSFLIQLAVEPDTVRATITQMDRFADWEWLARGQAAMSAYDPHAAAAEEDAPNAADGGAADGDEALAERSPDNPIISHRRPTDTAPLDPLPEVTAPGVSEAWHQEFLAHLEAGGSDAVTWNAERGADGILPPRIDGDEAEVVYAHPHGLYVNYDVAHVERLPHGHLLLLTLQPALGIFHNTMHGLLVVRARDETSPVQPENARRDAVDEPAVVLDE